MTGRRTAGGAQGGRAGAGRAGAQLLPSIVDGFVAGWSG